MDEDAAALRAGEDALRKVQSMLEQISEVSRTPERGFLGGAARGGRGRDGRANDEGNREPNDGRRERLLAEPQAMDDNDDKYYGEDGQLLPAQLRAAYRVSKSYAPEPEGQTGPDDVGLVAPAETLALMPAPVVALPHHEDDHVAMAQLMSRPVQIEGAEVAFQSGMLETVQSFREICLRKIHTQGGSMREKLFSVRQSVNVRRKVGQEMVARLQEEVYTWELVELLHSSLVPETDDLCAMLPNASLAERYSQDRQLQVWNTVTQWLHAMALHKTGLYESLMSDGSDDNRRKRVGPYLANTIQAALRGDGNEQGLSLDPDVSVRGGDNPAESPLDIDDQDDQAHMLEQLWNLVRAGAFYVDGNGVEPSGTAAWLFEKAVEVCNEFGEPWRIASLKGGQPFGARSATQVQMTGNPFRSLWKNSCLKLTQRMLAKAQQRGGDLGSAKVRAAVLEGAIYAAISGDLEGLNSSPLCRTWQDHLWASMSCMVQCQLDRMLIDHQRALEAEDAHTRGPNHEAHDQALLSRAERVGALDEVDVLNKVAEGVAHAESYFFEIQRALILGRFGELVTGTQQTNNVTPLKLSLCHFLCGEHWNELANATVADICGPDLLAHDIDLDASRNAAPCWGLEHHNLCAQLLRFTSHLVLYLNARLSNTAVVDEQAAVPPGAVEALLVAYVRILLQDDTEIVARYKQIPAFFSNMREVVALAIQAAMFEAATPLHQVGKVELLDEWQRVLSPNSNQSLLPRAARQALRNVRRQWLRKEPQAAFVAGALKVFERFRDAGEESLADADSKVRAGDGQSDEARRARVFATWDWLSGVSGAVLESLVQGTGILRTLVLRYLDTDAELQRRSLRMSAINLLNERLSPTLRWLVQDQPDADISFVQREMQCWEVYLRAEYEISVWNGRMQALEQEDPAALAADTCNAMFASTEQVIELTRAALCFPGGWLVDVDEPPGPDPLFDDGNDPMTKEELAFRRDLVGTSLSKPGDLRKRIVPQLAEHFVSIQLSAALKLVHLSTYRQFSDPKLVDERVIPLLERAFRVVDIVAQDSLGLEPCFDSSEMKALLELVRQCGLQLVQFKGNNAFSFPSLPKV
ncbi:Nuclear pore complex protein Nup107 (107 kDa nucleoporin) (Nucleoporin Nup107) [Durusdinium trenchii]|uniref:Nuclear pore complex protein n=1 Tax=Durusdinium trenchii TaxID=1381693 RepID=A0ABP0QSW8_9DINO